MVGFDSEDRGNADPFLWAFVHPGGQWSTRNRAEALEYVARMSADRAARGERLELWATNLEYDLCNLFGPERIAECSLRFGRSFLCGATWRGADMRDTIRHVPASVEELGSMVGLEKREAGMFRQRRAPTMAQYTRRCLRDASITYRAAAFFQETYQRLRVRPRMTLASTALNLWRERYWKREVMRPAPAVWESARQAYYGGRTQAFAVGMFDQVTAIDAASMFPWAMTVAPLPLPWGLVAEAARGDTLRPFGIYRVRIESNDPWPTLPVRGPEGTIYPRGSWIGWYVGEELLHAQARGVRVKVLGGWHLLETCDPFRGYVRGMFRRKQRARGGARTMYKLLLNALYGKFGQQGLTVRAMPLARFARLPAGKAPLEWREWNGLAIYSEESIPPEWSNMVWPAFVTARARMRLADEIETITRAGGRPLYCDTDSVMFQGPGGRYIEAARRIGQMERRGSYRRMLIVGRKEYALETAPGRWDPHAKGVPFAERLDYLRSGQASFRRPVKIRESGRIGVSAGVWREVTKQRRTELRAVRADGSLAVPKIGNGELLPGGSETYGTHDQ